MGTPKNFTLDQASHSVCFCSFGYCSCDTAQVWATLSLPMLTVNNVSCLLSQEEFLSWYACSGRTPFHCTAALFLFQMEMRTKFTVSPNFFFLVKITLNVPSSLWLQQLLLQISRSQLLYLFGHICLSVCSATSQRTVLDFMFIQFLLAKIGVMASKCFTC